MERTLKRTPPSSCWRIRGDWRPGAAGAPGGGVFLLGGGWGGGGGGGGGRPGRWFFLLGRWLASFPGDKQEEIRARMGLAGSEAWEKPPRIFSSLLQQGRLPRSERVLWAEFLGLEPPVAVFAAQMDCAGDSAWLYAAPGMPERFIRDLAEQPGHALDSSGKILERTFGLPDPLRL